VVEPLIEKGADGPLLARLGRQLVRLGDQRRQCLGCVERVAAKGAFDILPAASEGVAPGINAELPALLPPAHFPGKTAGASCLLL
jgi:hypothetical protein